MRIETPLLPDRWGSVPAKTLFKRVRRLPQEGYGVVTAFRDGEVTLRSNRRTEGFTNAIQEHGYQGVREGDLVIHSMDGFAGAIGVSDSDGKASPVVHCYRAQDHNDARFYAYLLRHLASSHFITALAKGIRERSTSFDAETFASLVLPRPGESEQRAIADFLDTETARIDALIAKKRHMIELLADRSRAGTDRLVLGLGGQPLNHSRTGFFHGVPRHWAETTARHLDCQVQTGPFGSQLHAEDYVEGGWPVVNPANLKDGEIVPIAAMAVSNGKRVELARHILRPGDIVFGRRGEMGRAGLVTAVQNGWLCGTGSLRLRLGKNSPVAPEYLKLLLETSALRRYFELTSIGSTMDNLNSDIVLGMPCVVPPRAEQSEIVKHVHVMRAQSDGLVSRLNSQIDLLKEHRQALITAAVTGDFEVPGVAA